MLSPMTESHFLKAYLISEVHLKKCLIMKPSPVHPNQRCNSFFLRTPKNLTDTLLMPFILFYQVQVLGWTDVFIGWVGRRGINGSQDTYMFKRKCSKKKKRKCSKKKKMLKFFQVAVPSAFPLAMYESSICSTYMFSESSHVQK